MSKQDLSSDTRLEAKLQNLQNQLSFYAIIAALVIGVQLIIMMIIKGITGDFWTTFFGKLPQHINLIVILAIASIPEGLPLVIQLALAFSITKMYNNDKVLVKDMNAPETMGQIEEILVGKTGTITKAKMKVAHFSIEGTQRVNSRKNTILNCEVDEYNL